MQTNTQSTEGKDPQQTTDESASRGAACSAFCVHRRGRGHWDISVPDGVGRVFAIRGEPGSFSVTDYRVSPCTQSIGFRTLDVVMAYCAAQLMHEPNNLFSLF